MFARVGGVRSCVLVAIAASGAGLLMTGPSAAADPPTKDQCILASENAQDLQKAGQLRDARSKLAVCVSDSCSAQLRQDCSQRLADVDKAMPTLVLIAKDTAGKDLSAVRVTMDGHILVESLNGTPIPVDPGEHRFFFEAAGLPLIEKTLVLRSSEKDRREFVVFPVPSPGPAPAAASPPATAPSAASAPPAGAPPAGASGGTAAALPSPTPQPGARGPSAVAVRDGRPQRMAGLVLTGAGAVGLIVGGIFGITTKTTYDHAIVNECGSVAGFPDATTCTATGTQDVQSAHVQATVSTVAFIGGACLIVGGAALYFTAPKTNGVSVAPAVGAGGAGLSVRGAW
jgi:hypothetical protein